MNVSWKRTWKRLVRQHFNNQLQIHRLHQELQRFRTKHNRIKQNIGKEAKNHEDKMQIINSLRFELDNYEERNKTKLSSIKRNRIRKLRKLLPGDSLLERVKQMEFFATGSRIRQSQVVESAYGKTQTAMERHLAKLVADEQALKRINHKTLMAMSDIRQLQLTIRYLKRNRCTKLKIKPYIDRTNWLEMTATPEKKDIRATIALDCSKQKRNNLITRQILDVRPPFLLRNIPELMPDRYHYLQHTQN